MGPIERRWAAPVLAGFAPEDGGGVAPSAGEVDWRGGAEAFLERASFEGRWAVRLGLLMVVAAPLFLWGRLRSGARLPSLDRARLLDQLLAHRLYAVRELALLLKLVACMTLFRVRALRDRTGYDPAPEAPLVTLSLTREVA